MGILDALFGTSSTSGKLTSKDFEKSLKQIPSLTSQERIFLQGAFGNDLKDGTISIDELKKEIISLKANKKDILSDEDIEKVRDKLSGAIVNKWNKI